MLSYTDDDNLCRCGKMRVNNLDEHFVGSVLSYCWNKQRLKQYSDGKLGVFAWFLFLSLRCVLSNTHQTKWVWRKTHEGRVSFSLALDRNWEENENACLETALQIRHKLTTASYLWVSFVLIFAEPKTFGYTLRGYGMQGTIDAFMLSMAYEDVSVQKHPRIRSKILSIYF